MRFRYRKIIWDSNFFGFDVCKINNTSILTSIDLENILSEVKSLNFRLCYLMVPHNNELYKDIAVKNCGLLVDEKVTFSQKNIIKKNYDSFSNICEYNNSLSLYEMHNLAIISSHHSRFRIDKNFKHDICDKMYRLWIEKSIMGTLAKKVFIYVENNSIKGLITCDIKKNNGIIGLMSVKLQEQGKKIGTKLISKSFDYFSGMEVNNVYVNTQLRNKDACIFYEKCGFSISKITDVYHFWL